MKVDESQARKHLLYRIHRQYQTVTIPVRVGDITLHFTRIADPDRVLDAVAEEETRLEKLHGRVAEDQLHLPYWAELWDSASGMAEWLAAANAGVGDRERGKGGDVQIGFDNPLFHPPLPHSPSPPLSTSTLDLGCGMGLSGTAAAALGHRVLFADLEPPALLFARLNSLPFADRCRYRRVDWRKDDLGEKFNLILGADILYERKQWDFLEPFWRAHLAKNGTILLGEPGRQTGDLFLQWIKDKGGWNLQLHEQPVATREKPIRLLELKMES
jgi:predicted nicotinamide N-methyase